MMNNPLEGTDVGGALASRMATQIDVREFPLTRGIADIMANIENEQAEALKQALEETDLDIAINNDIETRRSELLDIMEALLSDDLPRYWFEEMTGLSAEEFAEIEPYIGMEPDQWEEQKREWYQGYVDAGILDVPVSEASDDAINSVAETFISQKMPVTPQVFVSDVVGWHRGRAIRTLVAGPIESYTATIRELAGEHERKNERIRELEERLDEGDDE